MPCRALSPTGLIACLLAALAADLLFSVLTNCCLPERRRQHPCRPWLRPLAAAEACLIASLFSEGGRLAGHVQRRRWGNLCRSFDWFCGTMPGVVAWERCHVAARCACCALAMAAAGWASM